MCSPKAIFSASLILLSTGVFSLAAPNVIYILADDLGFNDLSCYGQETLKTPHLDRLAQNGIRFTSHYSGATVCAPSRYVLMTGKHNGHAGIRNNRIKAMGEEEFTIAELFKKAGYRTACIGKWGVGTPPDDDDPQRAGFDEFYGYLNMFHAHNYWPEFLIRNGEKEMLRNEVPDFFDEPTNYMQNAYYLEGRGVATKKVDYAPQLIQDDVLRFIRENEKNPFFLYYALNIPHANNEGGSGYTETGERIRGTQFNGMAVPDVGGFAMQDWPIQEQGFARMIQYIDDWVGEIVALLDELDLTEDTVVMFSSDNGPHHEGNHDHEFFDSNGDFRSYKRALFDGGVRVPFIASWPGTIPVGQESDLMSGFHDMMPTMAELIGTESPDTDGISIVPTLTANRDAQKRHEFLYWEFPSLDGRQALLYLNQWKAIRHNLYENKHAPVELYDITWDVGEQTDVAAAHPGLAKQLLAMMMEQHTPFDETWDLTTD
ncbi:arylsulfatase [Opitutia bacterium ISCC 51]|nr:arylsulfatase [Opitutae bacterium ISCC 51]QXD28680.1 arylsulfatase [Opitutae bacterium ISCC 52]